MKEKILYTLTFLFVLIGFGCSNNEKQENADCMTIFLQAKLELAPVGERVFPDWLSTKIAEIEVMHEKDVHITTIRIFKGEWQKRTVYYIFNMLNSCVFCDVYYENGEKIVWSSEEIASDNFCRTGKNWKMIYEFGELLKMSEKN
jgi:hypothetical protein